MTFKLVDFSATKPDGKQLIADGFRGVVGYVSGEAWKDFSKAQVDTYRKDGLAVGFVAEGTGREIITESSLIAECKRGNSIMASYGVPETVPLFLAVDFDPSPSNFATYASHFWAARISVKRPVGVYTNYYFLKYLYDNKKVVWGWQTYAWSYTHLDPRAQYYQYSNGHHVAGATVDLDSGNTFGGLWSPVAPPKPTPIPYPGRELKLTSSTVRDSAVAQVQSQLNKVMKTNLVVDGIFGPLTDTAVRNFQKSKGLVVDGIVGPKTWGALFA